MKRGCGTSGQLAAAGPAGASGGHLTHGAAELTARVGLRRVAAGATVAGACGARGHEFDTGIEEAGSRHPAGRPRVLIDEQMVHTAQPCIPGIPADPADRRGSIRAHLRQRRPGSRPSDMDPARLSGRVLVANLRHPLRSSFAERHRYRVYRIAEPGSHDTMSRHHRHHRHHRLTAPATRSRPVPGRRPWPCRRLPPPCGPRPSRPLGHTYCAVATGHAG